DRRRLRGRSAPAAQASTRPRPDRERLARERDARPRRARRAARRHRAGFPLERDGGHGQGRLAAGRLGARLRRRPGGGAALPPRSTSSPNRVSSWSTRSRGRASSDSRLPSSIPTLFTASWPSWWRMSSAERVVVEIAFDGGQIMGARLTSASADELEQALAARNDGALTLDADDGPHT